MSEQGPIRIVAISGSVRPGNYTGKALALVVDELSHHEDATLEVINPAEIDLVPPGTGPGSDSTQYLRDTVSRTTGVILATPEYHGSFSSVMKLVIENLGFPSALAGKPIALLGVAAGEIGAIKSLEHLRSVCSHIGGIVLPQLVSVPRVQAVFDEQGRCLDPRVEERVRSVATHLMDYIHGAVCPRVTLEEMLRKSTVV